MSRVSPSASRGFTLVELVVVLIILSVIAALALPKFIDLGAQARVARLQSLAAAVRQAADNVHAACLLQIDGCDVTQQHMNYGVLLDGPSQPGVDIVYGWPRAGYPNMVEARVLSTGFSVSAVGYTWWYADDAPTPTQCAVRYQDAFVRGPDLGYDIQVYSAGC